jgi:hypothetical protein
MFGGINAKFEFEACRKLELRTAAFDTAQDKLRAQRTFIRKSLCTLCLCGESDPGFGFRYSDFGFDF